MKVIDLAEVMRQTTLGRSTIFAYQKQNKFPASIKLSDRHAVWVQQEVTDWIDERIKASRTESPVEYARQEV